MGHLVPNRQVLSGPIPFVLIKGFPPSASPVEKPPECYFVILFVYIYIQFRVDIREWGGAYPAERAALAIKPIPTLPVSSWWRRRVPRQQRRLSLSPGLHSKMNEGIPRERGKSKLSCALLPFVLLSHSILVVVESSSVLRLIELS